MRFLASPRILILFIVFISFSGPAQDAGKGGQGASRELVQSWIHGAMDAMGSEEKLRAIHALEIKGIGFRNELEQSERPEGPWLPDFYQSSETRDFANGRMRTERQSRTLNITGWDNANWSPATVSVTSGGAVARWAQGKFSPGSAAGAIEGEETLALDPLRVLQTALDATDLHAEADARLHGFTQHVAAFTWQGEAVRLYLSSQSRMPGCIEVTRARPMDFFQGPWGDITVKTTFATWSLDPSGVRYPRQWSRELNGQPYSTFTANELKFNPAINEADFAIPEDVRKASLALARDIDDFPAGVSNASPLEVAPGIVYVNGPIGFHATEIRQADGIVILEAVISNGYSARMIEDAQKHFPGLPIKAVVTTSDSWPHFGGLREYAARGIPIYALDLNRPVLTRFMAAPHRMHPDSFAKNPRAVKFNFVSGRLALGAGENRMELIPLRTLTGERQMMVYFPGAKLVYTSDLFSFGRDGAIFLPQTAQEAVDAILREKLEVDRIYGMHYDPMPFQQLRDALAKFHRSNPQ
jgi:hypothetical protein